MKILSVKQIREADEYTIEHEPVPSVDLMERAAYACFRYIRSITPPYMPVDVYCGKGNNGGDGLALARMLSNTGHPVTARIVEHSEKSSKDFSLNFERLLSTRVSVHHIRSAGEIVPPDTSRRLVVDALLGSGLNKPLRGLISEVVEVLNRSGGIKLAIDIPTGLFADDNSSNDLKKIFRSDITLSFQTPKFSFFHRETAPFAGRPEILDIGLHPQAIENASTSYYHFTGEDARDLYRPRSRHSHKGTYGHALLIAGSKGMGGAAVLSGSGCLRAGTGLLTACIPSDIGAVFQTALPEAMTMTECGESHIGALPEVSKFDAIGMGPGLGTREETSAVLKQLIQTPAPPMVLDADALNILAENPTWLSFLPQDTILTPHPGEFARLLGQDKLESDYCDQLRQFSMKHGVLTVLKDSITTVAGKAGNVFFIDAGSEALACGGSGDVLTGVITALLVQGYSPIDAALLGVYIHARAGRLAGEKNAVESTIARDVSANLGDVFRELRIL